MFRRFIALAICLAMLQFTLAGAVMACVADAGDRGTPSHVAEHAVAPAAAHDGCTEESARNHQKSSTGSSGECQAMPACTPGINPPVVQLAAAANVTTTGVPRGHLLHALSRATAPDAPPPRA